MVSVVMDLYNACYAKTQLSYRVYVTLIANKIRPAEELL